MTAMSPVLQSLLLLLFLVSGGWTLSGNESSPLLTSSGHSLGSFLSDADCPSLSLCRTPLTSKSKVLPKWDELNCQCDDACATYGDCCVNAATFDPEATRASRHHWRCVEMTTYGGIYMLTTCPATWSEPRTRQLCEQRRPAPDAASSSSPRDPLAVTPVTNPRSRFTYPNYYCALCNEDSEGSVFWTPRLECGGLASYNASHGNVTADAVWSSISYDEARGGWGVRMDGVHSQRTTESLQESLQEDRTLVSSGFSPCSVLSQMPVTVSDLVRQCRALTDDCPSGWSNATVRHLCHSYTAVVYGGRSPEVSYRNVHCALCHEEDVALLSCHNMLFYRNMKPAGFAPSFAFLFDVNEAGGNVVGATRRCPVSGEVYDPFFRTCRQMLCASDRYRLRQGRCVLLEEEPEVATMDPDSSSREPNATTDVSDGGSPAPTPVVLPSPGATDCARFNISQVLYQIFANGSIYIERYGRLYTSQEYVASEDGSVLVCSPLTADESNYLYERKFSPVLAYLTLSGLGVSLTCLLFHLLAFAAVPSLRNLSGKNLASLCAALAGAYATFIVSQFEGLVSREACTAVAVVLYYCFLASFFWMNCIAFDVWRTLRLATSELRVSSGQQWTKFVAYSAYSWLGPAVIVAAAIAVENSSSVPPVFRPLFGAVTCWFGSRRALLIFFVTPVVTIVLLNVSMFGLSAHIIVSASQPSSSSSSQQQQTGSKARRNFRLYLRLALIMGLTWVFGILAGQVDREPLWYVFVVLNTLQGLFIFLSFTCTDKVWVHLRDRVLLKRGSYYSGSRGAQARKFELEGRDSGSGESQSSQTSRLSFTRTSQVSNKKR